MKPLTPWPRYFDIMAVLSVTTERLVSPNGMDDMYDILNFMTQDELLYRHQLPRACRMAAWEILKQHPPLVHVTDMVHRVCDRDQDLPDWLMSLRQRIIAHFEGEDKIILEPMKEWEHKNMILEACEMMGGNG